MVSSILSPSLPTSRSRPRSRAHFSPHGRRVSPISLQTLVLIASSSSAVTPSGRRAGARAPSLEACGSGARPVALGLSTDFALEVWAAAPGLRGVTSGEGTAEGTEGRLRWTGFASDPRRDGSIGGNCVASRRAAFVGDVLGLRSRSVSRLDSLWAEARASG